MAKVIRIPNNWRPRRYQQNVWRYLERGAKLRIEVRFRHLKALRPQRWGDSTTLITKSDDQFDPANLTLRSWRSRSRTLSLNREWRGTRPRS